MVEKYLWALHGCKPGPPTDEEDRLERQRLVRTLPPILDSLQVLEGLHTIDVLVHEVCKMPVMECWWMWPGESLL